MHDRSAKQRRPRFSCRCGTFSPSRRQMRSTRLRYNRWKRWGEMGVFVHMIKGLAADGAAPKTVMVDATYLKAHRKKSSQRVKRGSLAGLTAAP